MITIVSTEDGDWEGLYVEGDLLVEGHSLPIKEVIYAILREYPKYIEISDEEIAKFGYKLPESIYDLECG